MLEQKKRYESLYIETVIMQTRSEYLGSILYQINLFAKFVWTKSNAEAYHINIVQKNLVRYNAVCIYTIESSGSGQFNFLHL